MLCLGYRLWDKEKTKLAIAAEMVREAVSVFGSGSQVSLLCDSWYPKAEVAGLVDEFDNLDIICNARIDTVMYDLPPARTGKRGRPGKHREKVSPAQFSLSCPKTGNWKVGVRPVLTKLWGWERIVYALVTQPKSGGDSRRLFLCTKNPEEIRMGYAMCADENICELGRKTYSTFRCPVTCCAGT